jgi:tetratricopeptide (TPR) repeat protein/CHAT domain-containing protein
MTFVDGWTAWPLRVVVLAVLSWGIVPVVAANAQEGDDLAHLLAEVGRLDGQGRFGEALKVAKRAVSLARETQGEEHTDFAAAISYLAGIYQALGQYRQAEPLRKRSLAIYEKALGPNHQGVARALSHLGSLYLHQGRYKEAERPYRRSLTIYEQALGREHTEAALALNNLGDLYRVQGRYSEAEPLYERSLAIYEKALGQSHPDLAAALNNLGSLYRARGRYGEAERLYKRSLAIDEKALGVYHPDVATDLINLGGLYQDQGRYGEAEQPFKRSLSIYEKALGPTHPNVGTALNNLANLHQKQGRYAEAEPLFRRSLAINEKALGLDSLSVATALNSLAAFYASQGRYAEAEPLSKRSLAVREKALGPMHPSVATSLNNLANLYQNLGRYAEAEPLFKRSITISEKLLGPHHPSVATALNNLALLYTTQGRYVEAEPLYRRSLTIDEKALGRDHPSVATTLNNLASLYQDRGRYSEAEPLYVRSLAIYEKALGSMHPDVAMALSNLASLFQDMQDWPRAVDYWERSTAITKQRSERSLIGVVKRPAKEEPPQHSRFEGLIKVTHRLVGDGRASASATSEMFGSAQWVQGSEAATALAEMATRSAKGAPQLAALVRERQDLVNEWWAKDKLLIAAKAEPSNIRKGAAERLLADRLAAIDTRLAEITRRLAQDFPDYASLANPAPLSIAEVHALLRPDEALVLFLDTPEWRPLPEESFIWVVTKTEVLWVRTDLGTDALTREVSALRCGLDAVAWDGDGAQQCAKALGIPVGQQPSSQLPFDHSRAHKLYVALFGQVENLIKGKHLLVVPSGPLTQLPFQALVTQPPASNDHRAAAWLAREHAITVLPAVSSLKALRRVAQPSTAQRPLIGIGNPLLDGAGTLSADRAKLARAKEGCPEMLGRWEEAATARHASVERVATRGTLADVMFLKRLEPLPETADELCAVAHALNTDFARDIRLGSQATESNVKRLSASGELAKYRIIHFATHGALAGELDKTREPGLILTPPVIASEEDDGYLSASEIANLKLDADWVVMSACNTAAGGARNAEALSGLGRAFIYAGARSLLVSHWAVYSAATVKLVTGAVREIARDATVGRAEAMRRSMLALIDNGSPEEAHPSYWAPFVVVGEGAAGR